MKNMLNGKNKSHKLKKERIVDTKRTRKATNTVTKAVPKDSNTSWETRASYGCSINITFELVEKRRMPKNFNGIMSFGEMN